MPFASKIKNNPKNEDLKVGEKINKFITDFVSTWVKVMNLDRFDLN